MLLVSAQVDCEPELRRKKGPAPLFSGLLFILHFIFLGSVLLYFRLSALIVYEQTRPLFALIGCYKTEELGASGLLFGVVGLQALWYCKASLVLIQVLLYWMIWPTIIRMYYCRVLFPCGCR